jgi:hypothetical protein
VKLTMRINKTGADFSLGGQDGVGAARAAASGAASAAGWDSVELSHVGSAAFSAIKAVVGSGGYETDSLLTAGRIIDSALARID